jgi:hypothetical protein
LKANSFLCFLAAASLSLLRCDCRADGPPVIDIYEHDAQGDSTDDLIADIGKSRVQIRRTAVNRRFAQQLLDFRIMKLGGLQGAIFRTLHAHRDKRSRQWQTEEDSSFRAWAPEAAANGVKVGAYWFYRKGVPVKQQVQEFLAAIRRTCRLPRRYVAKGESSRPLFGQKILLAVNSANFDRETNESDISVLRRTLEALRELHNQTGVWPGYYPEMGDPEEGGLADIFASGGNQLTSDELNDFRHCWLWISSFSAEPQQYAMRHFVRIWPSWTLWQYCPSETWQRKNKDNWIPTRSSREDYGGGLALLPFNEYPRGIMGAAVPLDCNKLNPAEITIDELWDRHGWIAIKQ